MKSVLKYSIADKKNIEIIVGEHYIFIHRNYAFQYRLYRLIQQTQECCPHKRTSHSPRQIGQE
jgi:hypothetical protein